MGRGGKQKKKSITIIPELIERPPPPPPSPARQLLIFDVVQFGGRWEEERPGLNFEFWNFVMA